MNHSPSALESSKLGSWYKHSTITLLTSTIDDWLACLERHNSVHSLLLDLAKKLLTLFHTMHRLLIQLESLGIHGNSLS